MLRIASISNNYGKSYDGVGDFARAQNSSFPDWVECVNYSADCTYEVSKLKRFLNLGMTKVIFNVLKEEQDSNYDAVIMEYPFVEWNPLILIPTYFLSKSLKKKHKLFVLSLHEYLRVNRLRKAVIRFICKQSDMILVTTEEIKKEISVFNSNVFIRPIPTNLYNEKALNETAQKDGSIYVYFGLVNGSKAFYEMLNAWDDYNKDETKTLYVFTGTPIENIEKQYKGVKYFYNKQDYEIISIMRKAVACFIPVKPYVDEKNTTFKTGCLCGCLCIGVFSNEFTNYNFINHMIDYSKKSFEQAFEKMEQLTSEEIELLSNEAAEFGKQFSPSNTAVLVAETIAKYKGDL